jgi:hypothetical protein
MADLRDYTKKNPIFVGTDGVRLPTGTNAQRVASANVAGTMRFNTDIDGIETYTTAGWRPLAAPPSISTVSPSTFSGESGTEFTINGEGFTPDAQVYFVTSNGTSILASTVSYYSAVQVRATTPRAIRVQEEPVSVRVVQQSGTTTKTDCIDAGGVPNWITTAGTLGSIFGANTVNVYVSATDPEGTSVTYQITSGSLPGGLNFTTANGLIQGLASSVLANTTYNFTIKANDTVSNNTDRSFSYTVLNRAPVINTAAGSLGTIYSGNAASASISAYDPDGGQLTYSVSSGTLPVNSSLGSANGVITGTPVVVTTNTTYSFTLTSTDEGSLTASNNYTYTVLNRPPLINTAAGSLGTIVSGNTISTTIDAYDPDGAAVSFAITSGNLMATANIGSSNGTITASNSLIVLANTTYTFTVRATDVGEMSVSNTYTYTVLNRPPLWNTAATLSAINGADPYTTITVNAYDPDGGSVTYSLTSGSVPSGLTFVSANATIIGSANEVTENTTSTFIVTATDPGSDANTRTFSLTVTPATDNEFANTVLLLKTAGNTVVSDASANNLPLSVVADARASNFNPFGNSWSNYFDGTDDHLYVSSKSSIDWMISSGNSGTIEAWIYVTQYRSAASAYHHPSILGMGETYLNFGVRSGGTLRLYWYQGGETYLDSSTTVPLNTWTHVAAVVNGSGSNNLKLYINGVNSGTGTFSNIFWSSGSGGNDLRIGCEGGAASSKWLGYISNLRVSNNAVYTANFSPSTTPLTTTASTTLLTCHKNRFVDETGTYTFTRNGDTKVSKFGPFSETDTSNGSMYFDGTGDYLILNQTTATDLGSNNFTLEFWIHFNGATTNSYNITGKWNSGSQWILQWRAAGVDSITNQHWRFYTNNGGGPSTDFQESSTTAVSAYVWHHIAVVRNGNNFNLYRNGVQIGSTLVSSSAITATSDTLQIGSAQNGFIPFDGYISNYRLVIGSAVYTTSFTPPTAPLTAIANTSLLTLQNRQPHNNHGFQDTSNNRHLVTRAGNASQGTFTPFSADPGKWSTYFSGSSGTRLTYPGSASTYVSGTGDFTIEMWINIDPASAGRSRVLIEGDVSNGIQFRLGPSNTSNINGLSVSRVFQADNEYCNFTFAFNTWYHVAVVRASAVYYFFVNGVQYTTQNVGQTSTYNFQVPSLVSIGDNASYPNDEIYKGYISNIRVSNVGRYTSNFTPSTTPSTALSNTQFLSLQDNRWVDRSTNASAISVVGSSGTPFIQPFSPFAPNSVYTTANTGGSMYLDGTGDWLSLSPDVFRFASTSKFTIEGWFYSPGSTTGNFFSLYGCSNGGGGSLKIAAYDSGDGAITFDITGSSKVKTTTSVRTLMNGGWTHIALVREGTGTNETKVYINGVQNGVGTVNDDFYPLSNPFIVGHNGEFYSNPFKGYISNFRIVIGHAIYTSAFTPSNVPLTVTPNTSLLLASTDAAIIDYTGKNILETTGDAKANNSVYKFSPGSMSFDGTGDYLQLFSPPWFALGTGNFTIECWVYFPTLTNASNYMPVIDMRPTNTNGAYPLLYCNTSGTYYYVNTSDVITGSVLSLNTWTHLAICRFNSQTKMFINGTQSGSTYSDTNSYLVGTNRPLISGSGYDSSVFLTGRINDLRITRSARYTTTFTAPTRTFPNR